MKADIGADQCELSAKARAALREEMAVGADAASKE